MTPSLLKAPTRKISLKTLILEKMLLEILTTGSLMVNIGYQMPQLILLAKRSKSGQVPQVSGKPIEKKKALTMHSIMIKTTGIYFAIFYLINNEVPFLSWCYQLTSVVQDLSMMYFW